MVRDVYERYARPMARVVHGLPISWEPVVATVYHEDLSDIAAWSPCNKFVAVARSGAVEIRDAVTLSLLNTFKSPSPTDRDVHWLGFSPDSSFLTQLNRRDFITWDLQTGGSVGTTFPGRLHPDESVSPRATYSLDGKMLAGVYVYRDLDRCIITHDLSTTRAHFYSVPKELDILQIWTHGEFLRFYTVESEYVTIWEVDFTFTHPPKAVGSFPHLADGTFQTSLFLPSLSRFAVMLGKTVSVLDLPNSKFLLKTACPVHSYMSFSSDGRFFACGGSTEVRVFKESPAGYILHHKFAGAFRQPLLSPNGESIIVPLLSTIHLWHTKDPILSDGPTPVNIQFGFILRFSQNEASAAFARCWGNTVTIIDPRSGDPQLVIDTGLEIESLGATESTVVVIGRDRRVVTWNLAVGNARASINDSVYLDLSPPSQLRSAEHISVSPGLTRILIRGGRMFAKVLEIFDASTGRYLTGAHMSDSTQRLHFSSDGCEIWGTDLRFATTEAWRIIEDNEFGTTMLQPLENTAPPPGIPPWQSSRGYEVTHGGWILGPTKKRLLWLPHRWRSEKAGRIWSGRFLGLTNYQLSEAIILELFD